MKPVLRHADVSEKALEAYLARRVRALGGVCIKYANAAEAGYPDRVALLPGGVTVWVELKSRGCRPRILQEMRHRQMRRLGHRVAVCDSREAIDALLAAEEGA